MFSERLMKVILAPTKNDEELKAEALKIITGNNIRYGDAVKLDSKDSLVGFVIETSSGLHNKGVEKEVIIAFIKSLRLTYLENENEKDACGLLVYVETLTGVGAVKTYSIKEGKII